MVASKINLKVRYFLISLSKSLIVIGVCLNPIPVSKAQHDKPLLLDRNPNLERLNFPIPENRFFEEGREYFLEKSEFLINNDASSEEDILHIDSEILNEIREVAPASLLLIFCDREN